MKRLIPIKVNFDEEENSWTFSPSEEGMQKFLIHNKDEKLIRRALRRIKAKDSKIYPNRRKLTTYQDMLDGIKSGQTNTIYVWKSFYPVSKQVIDELFS
jgi:hypothetical protein